MKALITTITLAIALSATAWAQTPAPAPMSKEATSLQGTWAVTSMNGQSPTDQGAEIALVFTGNKYQVYINGSVDESGTFKLDPAKTPMSFDLTIVEGNDAGKLQLGIIEIKADVIQGLLGAPGATTRPADFNSDAGEILFVAKKVK